MKCVSTQVEMDEVSWRERETFARSERRTPISPHPLAIRRKTVYDAQAAQHRDTGLPRVVRRRAPRHGRVGGPARAVRAGRVPPSARR
ncbi:hypothetical protein THAOC_37311, partial [Thalassiosira oceanica]